MPIVSRKWSGVEPVYRRIPEVGRPLLDLPPIWVVLEVVYNICVHDCNDGAHDEDETTDDRYVAAHVRGSGATARGARVAESRKILLFLIQHCCVDYE